MTQLPRPTLPTGTIVLAGTSVDYRSLSRHQAITLNTFKGDPDGAEDYIVACGLGVSIQEAHDWRDNVSLETAGPLIDAILDISGLTDQGDGADPKG